MKKFSRAVSPVVVVLVSIQPLSAQIQGQWVATGALQSARELKAQVLMVNGKVLSTGGVDNNGNVLASAEVYNAGPGNWTHTGSMAEARKLFPAIALTTGKVLVSGGLGADGKVLDGAELYEPTTGKWSSAGSLSVARFGHTATLLHSGKVLVAGGCTASNCGEDTAESELYDPTSNRWSRTGSLNTARHYHTAVRLNSGKVLAIGGSAGTATKSCELYDPFKGTWSNTANTNVARYLNATTLLADGKVLVTGGTPYRRPLNSAEIYDPRANTWTLTGNMTMGHYAHTATLLTDGTVLVAGGKGQAISCGKDCTTYIPAAEAEIYNAATGKFTATESLSRPRAYHSATLLETGRALVDGGIGTTSVCCVVLGTAEIYTPLTMTFSATHLNFGVLQIGLTSAPQTVTITNVSTHSVTFASIASSGDFSHSTTCPSTLKAGQNCTIIISFTPTAAETRNGSVTLKDNDPGSPTQRIALTGIGARHAITLLPSSVSFPGQIPGTSSSPMNITLYNDGTVAVKIESINIYPADGAFTVTNKCPAILNPKANCVIQVVFTPPDSGDYTASLSVTDGDEGVVQTASVYGVGLD